MKGVFYATNAGTTPPLTWGPCGTHTPRKGKGTVHALVEKNNPFELII